MERIGRYYRNVPYQFVDNKIVLAVIEIKLTENAVNHGNVCNVPWSETSCVLCVRVICVRACVRACLHTYVLAYLERKGERSLGFIETHQFYQVCKDDWHFGKTNP